VRRQRCTIQKDGKDRTLSIVSRQTHAVNAKEIIYDKVGTLPGLTHPNTAIVLEEKRFPVTRQFLPDRGLE